MDYFRELVWRALVDTWNGVLGSPLVTIFAAFLMWGFSFWLQHHNRKGGEVSTNFRDSLRSLIPVGIVLLLFFVAHLRIFAPVALDREKRELISSLESYVEDIERYRPLLNPTLLIDAVSTNAVIYHYEILNAGHTMAYDITSETAEPGYRGASSMLLTNQLAPGSKLSILGNFLGVPLGEPVHAQLWLSYRFESSGTNHAFGSSHDFVIPKQVLRPGFTAQPIRNSYQPDLLHPSLREPATIDKEIGRKEGSAYFRLPERDIDTGAFLQYWAISTNRGLVCIPETGFLAFWSGLEDGKIVLFSHEFPTNINTSHRLFLGWSTNSASMRFDDQRWVFPANEGE